jgi:hypothetical protein
MVESLRSSGLKRNPVLQRIFGVFCPFVHAPYQVFYGIGRNRTQSTAAHNVYCSDDP